MKCNASRTNGTPCNAWAVKGKTKCRVHGGMSRSGVASATFKTGRFSKHLPTRMQAEYEATMKDPDYLNLRKMVATTDARLGDLIKRVDTGESSRIWNELVKTKRELQFAVDKDKRKQLLDYLFSLIDRGNADYAAWHDVGVQIEQRRKLVGQETTRLEKMHNVYTAEQGLLMIGQILKVIKDNIDDRELLAKISRGIDALTQSPLESIGS